MPWFTQPFQHDVRDVLTNMSLSLLLGIVAGWLYRYTHRGFSYRRTIAFKMVGVCLNVTVFVMLTSNSLGVSLGALAMASIVRFRNASKDPRDLSYFFLATGMGLVAATGDYIFAFECVLTICIIVMFLYEIQFGRMDHPDFTLTFCLPTPEAVQVFHRASPELFSRVVLRSTEQLDPQHFEYVYLVFPKLKSIEDTLTELKTQVAGISRISLIRPEVMVDA